MTDWLTDLCVVWKNSRTGIGNLRKRWADKPVGYVMLDVGGPLPEFAPPPPPWARLPIPLVQAPPPPLSLSLLRRRLKRIAADPRPKGVIIRLHVLGGGWATAQSLRDALLKFRADGDKRVVIYADYLTTKSYFVASVADDIIMPPGAEWDAAGLRAEVTFYGDALAEWGVRAEVVNVSPYKTAWDTLSRGDMSPEHRENIEWMLDHVFDTVVAAVAEQREMAPERVRELIDQAPLTARQATEAGLIDAALYVDELADYLGDGRRERITTWPKAQRLLPIEVTWPTAERIAIVQIEGNITPGRSEPPGLPLPIPLPFFDGPQVGAESVAQSLRDIERDSSMAAVVLYVNSGGGSAQASDQIWREVERLRRKKPVVAYFADAAASGGYCVGVPANWIVAQPLTVTGSIGVISMKLAPLGLFERFKVRPVRIKRGAHAGVYDDPAPFDDESRSVFARSVDASYDQFKARVITGRNLTHRTIEPLAGGRVWLGSQALQHGLIDALGNLETAIEKARTLVGLDADAPTPLVLVDMGGANILPEPFPTSMARARRKLENLASVRLWYHSMLNIRIE